MSSTLFLRQSSIAPSRQPGTRLPVTKKALKVAVANPGLRAQTSESSIPRIVAARAAASPEATALGCGVERLTYGELNDQANQIANYLISLGVGAVDPSNGNNPDNLVGLCLDRSITGVVCALGILKAGGAYLPLEPNYPAERLVLMLNDARPRVLITTRQVAAQLPAGPWHVIVIEHDQAIISCESTDSPNIQITPEHLAYVIYTSGSTGQPKGVEITHASLMNLVSWHRNAFGVTAQDRASLLAGVGFDAAVWETWPYLAAGASLHLPPKTARLSPVLLRDWLVAEDITISFLPTVLAEGVMTLEWPQHTALRTLLTGAETLRQFPSADLPFKVINNYGPTECTVVATSGIVPNAVDSNNLPTIGFPIANTQVYILNESMQRVPLQTPGEIYIGGKGVARGYLNRPDLTAEKFVRDPFSNDPDARLYRTGDLARQLANGEIAYLGRTDEQIKILGHRIEPNEIVTVLNRHPQILASRVIARGEACCEKLLVAYVVMNPESRCSAAELRSSLSQELPPYMVPSVFVRIDSLPLTQNGKVDLAALPSPNAENTLRDEEFIAPRTPLEERLSVMLSALLGLGQVSVNDNFFMLGGHSLLGTQLISQIRGAFGVELALRTLFESPTIEDLAIEIERLVLARIEAMSEDEVTKLLV